LPSITLGKEFTECNCGFAECPYVRIRDHDDVNQNLIYCKTYSLEIKIAVVWHQNSSCSCVFSCHHGDLHRLRRQALVQKTSIGIKFEYDARSCDRGSTHRSPSH
jgi:hypothetical protein